MELGVVHALDHERVVAPRDEGARGEDHAVVEVLDAELGVQAVVDPLRQVVYVLLVDVVLVEQGSVVLDVLEAARSGTGILLGTLEHARLVPVVEDAHDPPVVRAHDADVLEELVRLRLAELDPRGLRLEHHRDIRPVGRKVPAVRLVRHAGKAELVERG